jgi:hypothetical protein
MLGGATVRELRSSPVAGAREFLAGELQQLRSSSVHETVAIPTHRLPPAPSRIKDP